MIERNRFPLLAGRLIISLGIILCLFSCGEKEPEAEDEAAATESETVASDPEADAPEAEPDSPDEETEEAQPEPEAADEETEAVAGPEAEPQAEAEGESKDEPGAAEEEAAGTKSDSAEPADSEKAPPDQPEESEVRRKPPSPFEQVRAGNYLIRNTVQGSMAQRKEDRPDSLWRYYMHGVVDHFAKVLLWEDLFADTQASTDWLAPGTMLMTEYKISQAPPIEMTGKNSLKLGKPLPIAVERYVGQTLRLFVWVKGHGVGSEKSCWAGPPGMDIELIGNNGKCLVKFDSIIKAQGSFKWHCYYRDVSIPKSFSENVATEESSAGAYSGSTGYGTTFGSTAEDTLSKPGLHITLYNNHEGTVWFSTLSWEAVTESNTYTNNEKQDPFSGSLAFNPYADPLPYHFRWGAANQHKWRFLGGKDAGVPGMPNLRTAKGVKEWFLGKAQQDPEHLYHGLRNLAYFYNYGKAFDLLPVMENGWAESVEGIVTQAQDEKTGFWGYASQPLSMAVTRCCAEGMFGHHGIVRSDREKTPRPWLSLGTKDLPRSDKIIETVLSTQAPRPEGGDKKAGWSLYAHDYLGQGINPDHEGERCSLATTDDAVFLLRLAAGNRGSDPREAVYQRIRDALGYVLRKCVTADGLWRQDATDTEVSTGGFLPDLINSTSYLERRIDPDRTPPAVSAFATKEGDVTFTWDKTGADTVSVRIYAIPSDGAPEEADEEAIAGIIMRSGSSPVTMDPLLAVRKMQDAAAKRWGLDWNLGEESYTQWKMAKIKDQLPSVTDGAPLVLPGAELSDKEAYASSVTWYGEESKLTRITIPESAEPQDDSIGPGTEPGTGTAPDSTFQ